MWSILPKSELNSFTNKYRELQQHCENYEFILEDKEKYYIMPRYFHKSYPWHNMILHEDNTFNEKDIDIEFIGELRDNQKEGAKQLELIYNYNGEIKGLFKAPPGYGKTCMGSWATCMTKKKTLIILDNSILVDQWKDAYIKFTSLTEDDIGIFQGQKLEIDRPVVITMVQTLIAKQKSDMKEWYNKIKEAGFGLIHYDECHCTASGSKYALASLFINTRNVIGWSATPYAHGANKILLSNCIGDLIYGAQTYETTPEISFIKFDSGLGKKHGYRMNRSADYVRSIAYYNSIIYKSQQYLNTICDVALKLSNKGHHTLIITSTIKQVDTIIDHLNSNGLVAIPFHASERELDKDKDKLLVGTMKFVSKGFDNDRLSALIYASPLKGKISVIQTIGRVIRKKEGKLPSEVIDLIDTSFGNTFIDNIKIKSNIIKNEFGKNTKINII